MNIKAPTASFHEFLTRVDSPHFMFVADPSHQFLLKVAGFNSRENPEFALIYELAELILNEEDVPGKCPVFDAGVAILNKFRKKTDPVEDEYRAHQESKLDKTLN